MHLPWWVALLMGLAAWWDRRTGQQARWDWTWWPARYDPGRDGWTVALPTPRGPTVRVVQREDVADRLLIGVIAGRVQTRFAPGRESRLYLVRCWDGWLPGRYV